MKRCPKCSAEVEDGLKFCPKCGASLDETDIKAGQTETAAATSAAPSAWSDAGVKKRGSGTNGPDAAAAASKKTDGNRRRKKRAGDGDAADGSAPEDGRRKRLPLGWITSLVLLAALLGVIFVPRLFPPAESFISRSPEAAIKQTVGFIRDGDTESALRSMWGFNAEATAEVSFSEFVERYGYFYAGTTMLPDTFETYAELNTEIFKGEAVDYIKRFYLSTTAAVREGRLVLSDTVSVGSGRYESAGELSSDLAPNGVSGLVIEQIKLAKPEVQRSQSVQATFGQRNEVFGFSESREYAVLLTLDRKSYVCGVTVVRTGGGWQVYSFTSSLTGTSSYGCLAPVTEEEYAALVK